MTTPQDATEALAGALRATTDCSARCNHDGIEWHASSVGDLARIIAADLAADGWSVMRTEDVERLRRVEAAARDLMQRYYNAQDASDDEAVSQAFHEMRQYWTWYGGIITGDAALGDPS